MHLLHNLKRAWRIATQDIEYAPTYDLPTSWTEEDQKILLAFIQTETGTKLMKRLTNMVLKAAVAATKSPNDAQYNLGKARGVAATVNAVQEHFIASPSVRNIRSSVMKQPQRDAAVS